LTGRPSRTKPCRRRCCLPMRWQTQSRAEGRLSKNSTAIWYLVGEHVRQTCKRGFSCWPPQFEVLFQLDQHNQPPTSATQQTEYLPCCTANGAVLLLFNLLLLLLFRCTGSLSVAVWAPLAPWPAAAPPDSHPTALTKHRHRMPCSKMREGVGDTQARKHV
jgi:hypothetical protein